MFTIVSRFIIFLLLSTPAGAQLCTFPGQTPESAILVCGSESFYQTTPSSCGVINLPTPCPGGFNYQNTNPNFFRMACFSSGTLGFIITPDDMQANYSWQLFDITNSNPSSIFTAASLFVSCNWSSEPGETGASADGTNLVVCGGSGGPTFSKMPSIVAGRTYMLMVANESGSQGGYQLTFTGGTASITDNIEPHLLRASMGCNSQTVIVKMNKRVNCNSVAPDGSDFTIPGATIVSAVSGNCNSTTGSDTVVLTLTQPLPLGNHTIIMKQGSDGNTITDVCNRVIPVGESIAVESEQIVGTPMDSVFKTGCSPRYIELVFRKLIQCSSIAPDGSDFIVTGPQAVSTSVLLTCSSVPLVSIIRLNFSSPLVTAGTYQVQLVTGSDGNTITDNCGLDTPPTTLTFKVEDPVSSVFSMNAPATCKETIVSFSHDGNNNTATWNWDFGDGSFSELQNPVKVFTTGGTFRVKLSVSNNKCTDTSSQELVVGGILDAKFEVPPVLCPEDSVRVINRSTEGFDEWSWNSGHGFTSTQQTPPAWKYPLTSAEKEYTITLIAKNSTLGCGDTARHTVKTLGNCYIAVPSAFTPNNDGKNDYLFPLNALKADNLLFRVYNRYGQPVFSTRDWTRKWDGTINGQLQPAGVYAWFLSYTHRDTGQPVIQRGTVMLIR